MSSATTEIRKTADAIHTATSTALNPSPDVSGCPGTVARLAIPTVLRAYADAEHHFGGASASQSTTAPALSTTRCARVERRGVRGAAPNGNGSSRWPLRSRETAVVEAPEHRACRSHAPGERPRGRILDGPSAGIRAVSYGFRAWPPSVCVRPRGTSDYQHHIHVEGGAYRYAGLCVDHHEADDMPGGWDLGCTPVDKPVDNERSEA